MSAIQPRLVLYSQNFLKSSSLVDFLLDKSEIGSSDVVYEVGPGRGIITERLARRCSRVIAIEKDAQLVEMLRCTFAEQCNISIHHGDFLEYRLPRGHYKVFANIPFNITSAIVTHLTTAAIAPDDAYLIMQREAAQKFLGIPRESLFSVLLKPSFELTLLHNFRKSDFTPAPRVDVVMLRLRKRGPPLIARNDMTLFRDFVVYSFTACQPSLRATLKGIFTPRQLKLLSNIAGVHVDVTPTALRFEQWLCLFDSFKHVATPQVLQRIYGSETRLRKQQARLEKSHRTRFK